MATTREITILPAERRKGVNLQGVLHVPDAGPRRRYAVIILHPHPKMGGDLRNNVVGKLFRTVADAGFTALRVNTRGPS